MMPYAYIPDNAYDALPKLTHVAAKVMVTLAGFMPGNNSVGCFPSLAAIGERAGIAREKTITLAIKKLVAKGVLVCEHRRRQTNLFKWAVQGSTLTALPNSLGTAVTAPLDSSQGKALSAPWKDTRKDTNTITSLLYPQNNEKSSSCSASLEAQKITPKKPKVVMTDARFVIPDAIRQAWATAYPGADIDREAAKAFAWCRSNPRKTPKKDYGLFLNSWLGRAELAGKTTKQQDDDSIGYLLYKLEHIEAKHGEDVARRYDAKARELNSTIKADEWLKREIECRTA